MKGVNNKPDAGATPVDEHGARRRSVDATRHEMPTATSLERDAPREVPEADGEGGGAGDKPDVPGGERADNGND